MWIVCVCVCVCCQWRGGRLRPLRQRPSPITEPFSGAAAPFYLRPLTPARGSAAARPFRKAWRLFVLVPGFRVCGRV